MVNVCALRIGAVGLETAAAKTVTDESNPVIFLPDASTSRRGGQTTHSFRVHSIEALQVSCDAMNDVNERLRLWKWKSFATVTK